MKYRLQNQESLFGRKDKLYGLLRQERLNFLFQHLSLLGVHYHR